MPVQVAATHEVASEWSRCCEDVLRLMAVFTESDTVAAGVRERRTVMKFASLENMLTVATLVMFAVFLAWSVKIIAAWA